MKLIPTGPDVVGAIEARAEIREEMENGYRRVALESSLDDEAILATFGRMPLPPYILAARKSEQKDSGERQEKSDAAAGFDDEDRARYQTVYADSAGSVAAPTAGLHFTPELLARIEGSGVEIHRVTLHVGPGTFAPVKTDRIEDHEMHEERFEIGGEAATAIEAARRDPARRVIAVGTTVTRTLESCFLKHGHIQACAMDTRLMISPGFQFNVINGLITNFHLPKSTLLMLVSAFMGREAILGAYEEAVRKQYRFYSYGDAMFLSQGAVELERRL